MSNFSSLSAPSSSANSPRYSNCLLYRSLLSEVDTSYLFIDTKPDLCLFAPVTPAVDIMHWQQVQQNSLWRKGVFGILEPVGGKRWYADIAGKSILFCPLVGFDRLGMRLGMGKGCFDRWLAANRQYIDTVVGLAFACQEVDIIQYEEHDQSMDFIITEEESITICQT